MAPFLALSPSQSCPGNFHLLHVVRTTLIRPRTTFVAELLKTVENLSSKRFN